MYYTLHVFVMTIEYILEVEGVEQVHVWYYLKIYNVRTNITKLKLFQYKNLEFSSQFMKWPFLCQT